VLRLTHTGEAVLSQAVPLIEQLDAAFFGACNQAALLTELKQLHPEN
jgi:hypothetical protein